MRRSFVKRLILAHVSIVLVIAVSSATALVALRSTIQHTERTAEIDRRLELLRHLRADAREIARSARRYLLTGDLKEQQRVFAIESEMRQERTRLEPYSHRLDRHITDYTSTVVEHMTADAPDAGAALASFEDALMEARGPLGDVFDEILATEHARRQTSRSSQQLASGAQWALLAAAALGIVLTFGAVVAIVRVLKRQGERMREVDAVAERTMRSRKELLTASDALREPLERIQKEVTALRSDADTQSERGLTAIDAAAARVDAMLRQLLDVTSIQTGATSLRREPCDVARLVDRAVKHHRDGAHERGIQLRFEAQLAMTVSADGERIAHVLTTLIGIALESARIGGEIVVGAAPCDDGVRFAIIDTRVTVPMPSSFQPAVVTAPNELALHLARRVVEAHGGRMGVEMATAGRALWFTLSTEPRVLR